MCKYILAILLLTGVWGRTAAQEPRVAHVFVALCDNVNQGIVKVPAGIGNGQSPSTNLYWGCAYGISTYFKKSAQWSEVERQKMEGSILERVVFKHKTQNWYLVADAYDGKEIKECTSDFLKACAGQTKTGITLKSGTKIDIAGGSEVTAYIGHNGLMDFSLPNSYKNKDGRTRQAIILACAARQYFTAYLKNAGADPLLWTTNLMAPEAYTLHDALATYIAGGTAAEVRESGAAAYNRFQKCGLKAARGLLVTGY